MDMLLQVSALDKKDLSTLVFQQLNQQGLETLSLDCGPKQVSKQQTRAPK